MSASKLLGKIGAFKTIIQVNNLEKLLGKISPYTKEYDSALDLILDILRLGEYNEEGLTREILSLTLGDSSLATAIEGGYHGAINSLESKISKIESQEKYDSFIVKLENAVKILISSILTTFLSCSVSPYIPKRAMDKFYKKQGDKNLVPLNIPTHILDFSNTLHVSPVSESGVYFYNTPFNSITYYRRDEGVAEPSPATEGDVRERSAERYFIYNYEKIEDSSTLSKKERKSAVKVRSVPSGVKVKEGEKPPKEFVYVQRPKYTSESLYQTMDMNAFIWYVANRGDNFDETRQGAADERTMYEYNKMAWDSRRLNARKSDTARSTAEDWNNWLSSRTSWEGDLKFEKDGKEVKDLYPILQFEPSENYGHLEHLIVTFPAQRYLVSKKIQEREVKIARNIYKFNADYLRSIKIFNWKTLIMNLLYELNGISPIPDVEFNLSLSDEIINARLSSLILNTMTADDKEIDDSFFSFSNEDYSEALKRMELKKYSAKPYDTAGNPAIQNPSGTPIDTMNSVSTDATLNEIHSTITRGVYSVAGTSGSTGITKTELSYNLSYESNFVSQLLMAIMKPFIRLLLSPQVILLFCINLEVMGLVNLQDLSKGDCDAVIDFIFRKLAGIIKKFIVLVKNMIIRFLLTLVKKVIKKLVDEVIKILLLEQLNDYIRLLEQILECIRKFGIGKTLTGIDDVNYADIIPEVKPLEIKPLDRNRML